ncbi:MAG TPA: MerR family transcriptional regulator, partial [Patescibacteria group bacterium]|nr:MerR family transcriptional regulator [Patescibacteria group bacterium]
MNTVHSEKLYTLQEASVVLGVSVDVLLSWNHHNILKPTITPDGQIAYTKSQLDHFQIIRTAMSNIPEMSAYQQLPKNNETTAHAFRRFSTDPVIHTQTGGKPLTTQRIIVFSALTLFILFGISLLPQQSNQRLLLTKEQHVQQLAEDSVNDQKSTLTFSDESTLPIQLQQNQEKTKAIHNEGENVLQEQITAPTLYSDPKTEALAMQRHNEQIGSSAARKTGEALGLDTALLTDTYAFSSGQTQTSADHSAIDAQGNIQKDTLATIMGGIDDIAQGNDLTTTSTDPTMLLLLILFATGAGFYLSQNQLAVLGKRPQSTPVNPFQTDAKPHIEKVMEIAQKTDGTVILIVLGREYKLSKPEMNSESDRFIEQLMSLTYPDKKEIEYNSFRNTENSFLTPLSRLVTRLGFVGVKRDL